MAIMATAQYCASDKPTVQQLAIELRDLVNWQDLAILLPKIGMEHIRTIETNYPQNNNRQKNELYNKWLEVCPNATWSDVIGGLRKVEQTTLADNIEQRISTFIITSDYLKESIIEDTVITELEKLHRIFSNLCREVVNELDRLCRQEQ